MKAINVVLLTALAMIAFASNSLLCRAALKGNEIDPISFTSIRLISGAGMLLALVGGRKAGGNWVSAGALAAYAFAFSIAYDHLTTGTGALILFGAVQATMILVGMARGESPRPREWGGLLIAFAGLVVLLWPRVSAPDSTSALLMIAAGVAWGIYTLRARAGGRPLDVNAGNFLRSMAWAVPAVAIALVMGRSIHVTGLGIGLAVVSGALASGVGYAIWYAALKGLSGVQPAVVQLSVPPLAALGGVLVLHEELTILLVICGAVTLGGIAVAVTTKGRAS